MRSSWRMLCIPFRIVPAAQSARREAPRERSALPRAARHRTPPAQSRQGVRRNGAVRGFLGHRTQLAAQSVAPRAPNSSSPFAMTASQREFRMSSEPCATKWLASVTSTAPVPSRSCATGDDLVERAGHRTRLGEKHEPGPFVEQRLEVAKEHPPEPARPPVGHLDAFRERALPDRPAGVRLGDGQHHLVTFPESDARNQPAHQRLVSLSDGDLIFRPVRVRVPKPREIGPQVRFRRRIGPHRPGPQGARRAHGVEISRSARRVNDSATSESGSCMSGNEFSRGRMRDPV